MPVLALRGGGTVARLGLGTWRMGEARLARKDEAAVLRHAVGRGITLIDTAEMYGDGGAEEVVGDALRGLGSARDQLFLVSKVYPWNASRRGTVEACERSLTRMGVDRIDLYLLHWRGEHPLADTVAAFEKLKRDGKIGHWGVSNFDTGDMRELDAVENGRNAVVNQVYYNLAKRWPEATLLPWQRERGIATMAYSPLDQGALPAHKVLAPIAARHGVAPAQIALAWLLRAEDVIAIPKTSRIEGVDEIVGAPRIALQAEDMELLHRAFPPPRPAARMQTT
ncbi:MAG: aldo/keto reductase [Betaproteobacteria bacterium]